MIIAVPTGGDMFMNVWFLCLVCLAVAVLAQAQDNPGFISIDCGASIGYRDENLTIQYSSDAGFVDSGQNMQISIKYIDQVSYQQLTNLRTFPNGTRNCYTIRPDQGKNNKYLIRATFYYGNFDGKNQVGSFDLYIDTNFWNTVSTSDHIFTDIIYTPSRDYIQVCLVNRGTGDPFISALELRLLDNSTYPTSSGALRIKYRDNLGSQKSYRYPHDVYDRIWLGIVPIDPLIQMTNTAAVNFNSKNNYQVPSDVLSTAYQASNSSYNIIWTLSSLNATSKWYIYFHFAELQVLPSGQVRQLAVVVQGNTVAAFTPEYLQPVTVSTVSPATGSTITHYVSTENTFAPFVNAREVYIAIDLPNPLTDLDDVEAINATKKAYGITKGSWQGDPCSPKEFIWSGLNCSQDSSPRITSLNLSSSGLTGNIATSFVNLTALVSLDLSFNQLTGQLPEFLAQMPNLKMLNLSGNSLSGPIPTILKKKMSDGSLKITLDGNPLCQTEYCTPSSGEGNVESQKTSSVPIVIGVVISVVVLVSLIIAFVFYKKGSNGTHGGEVMKTNEKQEAALINGGWPTWNTETSQSEYETSKASQSVGSRDHGSHVIGNATRAYTPSEVLSITENFKVTIGGGGFGKVYSGTLTDGTKVAVKALSPRSAQGYKEFQAEAQLLMIVHHKNLVSLLGYCEEPGSMALIYELMPQGNVQEHLSENSTNVLGWIQRLQIAVDAAQGLEYLHDGCRPPIIHRDLKTSNILLDENMQAKIADFGLSRFFKPNDHESYVSTCPAGTPGYLDPMFQLTGNLNRKSDIYSFGIILFELITGHPAVIRNAKGSTHIVQWVSPLIQRGDLQSIVDPRFNGQFDTNSVWKVIETAMLCVQPVASERPETNQVLTDLKESLTVETNYSRDAEKGYTKSSSFEMTSVDLNLRPAAR